jgi:hypothetical protein
MTPSSESNTGLTILRKATLRRRKATFSGSKATLLNHKVTVSHDFALDPVNVSTPSAEPCP